MKRNLNQYKSQLQNIPNRKKAVSTIPVELKYEKQ